MIRVVIIGAGNVASHLFEALLHQESIEIVQCYNRKGNALAPGLYALNLVTKEIDQLAQADIYILAISDDAIAEVSSKIPEGNHLVVHTSGSVPMNTIDNKHRRGVFYPLQSFSKSKDVDFKTIPFCLESERKEDMNTLQKIATTLSKKVYKISSEQRNVLHVAAVFVNNFTNYLFSIGNDICKENDVPFEILQPLILETAKKITEIEPNKAQTGPAIRNDKNTINRHLSILSKETQKELYKTLTKAIQSTHGKEL